MKQAEDIIAAVGGGIKAALFLLLVALLIPVALLYKQINPANPFVVPRQFHRILVKILGLKIKVIGQPSASAPVLFVANHTSYLDIPILGSILTAAFVAKAEVASWPLFGFLSRVQNTLFIERRSSRAAEQRTQLQEHLAKHQNLILFPEGTSSEGVTALPFKSTLFSIVEESAHDVAITIQPVSIACTEFEGRPLLHEQRPLFAWYGDMTLEPHLWNVFKRGGFTVEVTFHQPIATSECPNRKLLAATCQSMVARGIEQSLSGHPQVQDRPVLTANE